MVTINYWSDFACPFCYIAEQRIHNVVKELNLEDQVRYKMHAFELNPDAPKIQEIDSITLIKERRQLSEDKALARVQYMNQLAQDVGIADFNYENAQFTNTMDAHCLVKYAQTESNTKANQLVEQLFHAFFVENQNLADIDTLLMYADRVGLNVECAKEALNKGTFKMMVRQDEIELGQMNLFSVPIIFIDDVLIQGVPSEQQIKDVLLDHTLSDKDITGMSCGINGCEL